MGYKFIDDNTLNNIAQAIRNKTESQDKIACKNFANQINNISTGSAFMKDNTTTEPTNATIARVKNFNVLAQPLAIDVTTINPAIKLVRKVTNIKPFANAPGSIKPNAITAKDMTNIAADIPIIVAAKLPRFLPASLVAAISPDIINPNTPIAIRP